MVTVLDLFSAAAGGWSLGMHRAGFTTIAACEAVDWRRTLYAQNNPGVPIYDDVRTLTAGRLVRDIGRLPDIVVGSPPCQDISSANTKGKGVEGERSGLFFEAVRIIGEVRPRWFALENSANLRTRGADAVLAALEELGYACWAVVVRASDIGANHERPRSWIIGCDVEQVADAGCAEAAGRAGLVWGQCSAQDAEGERAAQVDAGAAPHQHPAGLGHEGGWSRRHGPDGHGAAYAGDPEEIRCGSGLPGRCEGATGRTGEPPCRDDAYSAGERCSSWTGNVQGQRREDDWREPSDVSAHANGDSEHAQPVDGEMAVLSGMGADRESRKTPDPDQAGQADGCMVSGLRQEEIADDGCGDGRSADGPGIGQMDLCAPDSIGADGCGPLWSLDDLAGRLRLDDGLPARLAGTRVAVGGPRGTAAASLIVEAYGDAVCPQIPEAIGRAILRTEAALAAIYGPTPKQRTAA